MKEVTSIQEFFSETRGGRTPQADLSIYDGKLYDCGCGKKHEFYWKDGPHLIKQSYSPISTYVLRELRGMKFVFNMTHCNYYNVVKINFLGNFKTLLTFRHGDPQAQIRDYEEQFFKRAGVKNPMKKHYPENKEIKEVNTKAKPPELSSKTKKSTKKKPTKTKKVVKKKIVKKKKTIKENTNKLTDSDKEFFKLYNKYSKAYESFFKIEKQYLQLTKKRYRKDNKFLRDSAAFTKKDIKEMVAEDIKSFGEQFKKRNKDYLSFLEFLKKYKSEI